MGRVNAAIDVGNHNLGVAFGSEGEFLSLENEPHSIARLAKQLLKLTCERVLIESGSSQNVFAAAKRAEQLAAVILIPRRVREFGEGTGQSAKTDHIDVQMLAL